MCVCVYTKIYVAGESRKGDDYRWQTMLFPEVESMWDVLLF